MPFQPLHSKALACVLSHLAEVRESKYRGKRQGMLIISRTSQRCVNRNEKDAKLAEAFKWSHPYGCVNKNDKYFM